MIHVIDCKIGNIGNVTKALEHIGVRYCVTDRAVDVETAEKILLPGVGAFEAAMSTLIGSNLVASLKDRVSRGVPLLGICVGMQVLMSSSEEYGFHEGLGIIPGQVKKLKNGGNCKVPHVGWDSVSVLREHNFLGVLNGAKCFDAYFTHSFAAHPNNEEHVLGVSDGGYGPYASIVQRDQVFGCQFHLELSGTMGLALLAGFVNNV